MWPRGGVALACSLWPWRNLRVMELSARLRSRAVASLARVVHVPNFLSKDDIALVRRLERAHHNRLGPPPPARRGWHSTYLSAGGLLRAAAPELHRRLGELRYQVDVTPFLPQPQPSSEPLPSAGPLPSASAQQLLSGLEARCVELHEGRAGGSLDDPRHFYNGSVVTVDVMLDDGFTGGALCTLEADGSMLAHDFAAGDALVFPSYKYHSVTRITGGVRRTLVIEYWRGDENRCNHRCELLQPLGSELCDDARTGGCVDVVSASLTTPGPLGMGFGFTDAADPANQERRRSSRVE